MKQFAVMAALMLTVAAVIIALGLLGMGVTRA